MARNQAGSEGGVLGETDAKVTKIVQPSLQDRKYRGWVKKYLNNSLHNKNPQNQGAYLPTNLGLFVVVFFFFFK